MSAAYKYCGPEGVKILEGLDIKVTPPNEFNDPFEFTPRVISSKPLRKAFQELKNKQYIVNLFLQEIQSGRFTGNLRQYRQHVKKNYRQIAFDQAPLFETAGKMVQNDLIHEISKTFGVICLSSRRDSILMWGHYCERHTGIVVGFDSSNSFFKYEPYGLKAVRYVKDRIIYDATWLRNDPKMAEFDNELIFSKNADWEYEKELRMCATLSQLDKHPLSNGSLGYFLQLPPEVIGSVTLGARCTKALELKVLSALKKHKLSHVRIERAQLHENKFEMQFIPLILS